jgi:hypothetical protein
MAIKSPRVFTWHVALFLLLIPLFFINIHSSHDWGDDFAQYITQAKNIVEGIPQSQTGYIYNETYRQHAPPAYPIGFPLIIAPVYAVFGIDYIVFNYLTTSFLVLLALTFFIFFSKRFSYPNSLLLTLILVYNPWMLNFKMEVMADIPFVFFLFLAWLMYGKSKKTWQTVLTGTIFGFAILIKTVGIIALAALLFDSYIKALKTTKAENTKLKLFPAVQKPFIVSAVAIMLHIILNVIVFRLPGDGLTGYIAILNLPGLPKVILEGVGFYFYAFQSFFNFESGIVWVLPLGIHALIFCALLFGIINRRKKAHGAGDWFVMFYFVVLLLFPSHTTGFRYLLPVAAFLLIYAAEGVDAVKLNFPLQRKKLAMALGLIVLASYVYPGIEIIGKQNEIPDGPMSKESVEALRYLRFHTPDSAVIAFVKPRVLPLFTGHPALSNRPGQPAKEIDSVFRLKNVKYVLIHSKLSDDSLIYYICNNTKKYEMVWNNHTFRYYKRK